MSSKYILTAAAAAVLVLTPNVNATPLAQLQTAIQRNALGVDDDQTDSQDPAQLIDHEQISVAIITGDGIVKNTSSPIGGSGHIGLASNQKINLGVDEDNGPQDEEQRPSKSPIYGGSYWEEDDEVQIKRATIRGPNNAPAHNPIGGSGANSGTWYIPSNDQDEDEQKIKAVPIGAVKSPIRNGGAKVTLLDDDEAEEQVDDENQAEVAPLATNPQWFVRSDTNVERIRGYSKPVNSPISTTSGTDFSLKARKPSNQGIIGSIVDSIPVTPSPKKLIFGQDEMFSDDAEQHFLLPENFIAKNTNSPIRYSGSFIRLASDDDAQHVGYGKHANHASHGPHYRGSSPWDENTDFEASDNLYVQNVKSPLGGSGRIGLASEDELQAGWSPTNPDYIVVNGRRIYRDQLGKTEFASEREQYASEFNAGIHKLRNIIGGTEYGTFGPRRRY